MLVMSVNPASVRIISPMDLHGQVFGHQSLPLVSLCERLDELLTIPVKRVVCELESVLCERARRRMLADHCCIVVVGVGLPSAKVAEKCIKMALLALLVFSLPLFVYFLGLLVLTNLLGNASSKLKVGLLETILPTLEPLTVLVITMINCVVLSDVFFP